MAGVRYDAHYHITTVDPPELTRFIREQYPDVIFDRPRLSMRQLIIKNMTPPTRMQRYCCAELKEVNGIGHKMMTGARWAESLKRKNNQGLVTIFNGKRAADAANREGAEYKVNKHGGIIMNEDNDSARRTVEHCYRTNKTIINPIIDWTDDDVWEFIHAEHLPYCSLYDEGFYRLGCIGCPLGGKKNQKRDFERWPYMYRMYLHAFADMLEARKRAGKEDTTWTSAETVMEWWLREPPKAAQQIDGQIGIDDYWQ